MGDRAYVEIKDDTGSIFLYTHWNGSKLAETVKTALAKQWRWDDAPYLARIIFCEMVKGQEERETGFGISHAGNFDIDERRIVIDVGAHTVKVFHQPAVSFEDYIK